MRKRQVGIESCPGKAFEQSEGVAPPDEDVEVLGAAHVARVVAKRVAPADEVRDIESRHDLKRPAMTPASYV